MRRRALLALAILALAVSVGCGGGSDEEPTDAIDSRAVPTATLPAELPPVLLVGNEGLSIPVGRDGSLGNRTTYEVQAGDTPGSIAAQFEITVDDLLAANGLSSDAILNVGQRLVIPPTELGGPPSEVSGPDDGEGDPVDGDSDTGGTDADSGGTDGSTYVVQAGDFAGAIAAQFGISVEELAAANGMSVDEITNLSVGQTLVIP